MAARFNIHPKEANVKAKMTWLMACALVWSLSVAAALADEGRPADGDRAASCAREAKGLKGEEHTRAVNECVRAAENGAGLTSQQRKMKTCNAKAREKGVHGDERRAFMSACLKG